MNRLDIHDLKVLFARTGATLVLCAADTDGRTMAWAEAFAMLYAEWRVRDLPDMAFGYIDSESFPSACGLLAVNEAPAIVLMRNGRIARRWTDSPSFEMKRAGAVRSNSTMTQQTNIARSLSKRLPIPSNFVATGS